MASADLALLPGFPKFWTFLLLLPAVLSGFSSFARDLPLESPGGKDLTVWSQGSIPQKLLWGVCGWSPSSMLVADCWLFRLCVYKRQREWEWERQTNRWWDGGWGDGGGERKKRREREREESIEPLQQGLPSSMASTLIHPVLTWTSSSAHFWV